MELFQIILNILLTGIFHKTTLDYLNSIINDIYKQLHNLKYNNMIYYISNNLYYILYLYIIIYINLIK